MSTAATIAPAAYRDRAAWLAARKNGIGGSDVAALFGLHPFRTALDVYREKVGETPEREPTAPMLRGIYLEDVAAQLYTEKTGRRTRRHPMRTHPEFPFLLASVDRQVLADEAHDTGALEIKAPGLRVFGTILREGLPDYIALQGQMEALVLGYAYTAFAILNAERWQLLDFEVPADAPIQQRIIEVAGEFWTRHVLAGIPPEVDAPPPAIDLPATEGAVARREDAEWAQAVADLRLAREIEDEAKGLVEGAKTRVLELAGGYGVFEGAGARIYYRQMPGRKSFKKDLLTKAHPEIDLGQYEVQGKPFDEFRFYALRGEED